MIYTISEWFATISESLIIFFFLVKILSYKNMEQSKKIIGTIIFCCLQCASSLVLGPTEKKSVKTQSTMVKYK